MCGWLMERSVALVQAVIQAQVALIKKKVLVEFALRHRNMPWRQIPKSELRHSQLEFQTSPKMFHCCPYCAKPLQTGFAVRHCVAASRSCAKSREKHQLAKKNNEIEKASKIFHANKDILIEAEICQHFNIPKLHVILHYLNAIRALGLLDGYNTESPERLHINCAKEGYCASNHCDYVERWPSGFNFERQCGSGRHIWCGLRRDSPQYNQWVEKRWIIGG